MLRKPDYTANFEDRVIYAVDLAVRSAVYRAVSDAVWEINHD
jgi:hypothetical protein